MNTINEQTATLTKLIAEIVELDSDKQCLSVELDYLIKHLRLYKRTCEECVAMYKCSHPTDCECADCEKANPLCEDCRKRPKYDDGICEKCYDILQASICDSEESEEEESDEDSEDEEECEHCECEGCRGWKEEWGDEEGTTRVCEDATCGKEFSMYDPHYYDDDQCLCYCCEECYKNDSKDEKPVRIFVGEWGKAPIVSDSDDSDWDGDLDDTPNCHQCGEDCGRSIIAHQKYKKTYFCSEECNREYDGEDE
jgi:hypothetical protein